MKKFLNWLFGKEKKIENIETEKDIKCDFSITFGEFKTIEDCHRKTTLHTKVFLQKLNEEFEVGSDMFYGLILDRWANEVIVKFFRKQADGNYLLLCYEDIYYTEEKVKEAFCVFGTVEEGLDWDCVADSLYLSYLKAALEKAQVKGCFDKVTTVEII